MSFSSTDLRGEVLEAFAEADYEHPFPRRLRMVPEADRRLTAEGILRWRHRERRLSRAARRANRLRHDLRREAEAHALKCARMLAQKFDLGGRP